VAEIRAFLAQGALLSPGFESGEAAEEAVAVASVATDSRAVRPQSLFVALRGPRHDGNDFAREALGRGAVAAIVASDRARALRAETLLAGTEGILLPVADAYAALGAVARGLRLKRNLRVLAVTGSVGKTTVKEMARAILEFSRPGHVLATAGNFNNRVGLPLSLLSWKTGQTVAALELGASDFGEIAELSAIALPDAALVTKVAAAHLDNFGDLAGVARAKGEIFKGLGETGVALVNLSDPYLAPWAQKFSGPTLTFGKAGSGAEVLTLSRNELASGEGQEIELSAPAFRGQKVRARLWARGEAGAECALAAAAGAIALGAGPEEIRFGLESFRPLAGRGESFLTSRGLWVVDESYNACPASMEALVGTAARFPGRALFLLGDMLELGEAEAGEHLALGRRLAAAGAAFVVLVGERAALIGEGALAGGMEPARVYRASSPAAAAQKILSVARAGDAAWVKGSRAAGLEKAVAHLRLEG
jgi:UDP-N-acetylmuramoyl-tripeptide--D-alanyl-D-alanine ligase